MANIKRSLVEGAILLSFSFFYLLPHGGYRALPSLSPAAWIIIAGLLLLAGLQKILPVLMRRLNHQPEPPEPLSAAEWRLLILSLSLCCLLMLVFGAMWFLPLVLMPPISRWLRCFPSPDRKG